ncbi:MAG: PHP domain-containing protein, partial [Candidatus Heimdallarchaeota archaeon]|nr:PHP domain-containing protein [Candidatus Heimdallarchaeota archaeon]
MKVELHCHSTNSDGEWTVKELLMSAEEKGIKLLSITDHDNLNGSIEAFNLKSDYFSGELIPGIEISTKILENTVHLLAFFPTINIEPESELIKSLYKIQDSRTYRMKEMITKANSFGFDVSFEEVLEIAGKSIDGEAQPTDILSRPHLGRLLIKKGYCKDMNEAFDKYLSPGKPIHVGRFSLTFNEWIEQIKNQHGIIIWAHPLFGNDENINKLMEKGELLKKSKIDGLERIYKYEGKYPVNPEFIKLGNQYLDKIVKESNWLITAGGDFHGD